MEIWGRAMIEWKENETLVILKDWYQHGWDPKQYITVFWNWRVCHLYLLQPINFRLEDPYYFNNHHFSIEDFEDINRMSILSQEYVELRRIHKRMKRLLGLWSFVFYL